MSLTPAARPRARTFAFVGAVVVMLGLAAACSESRRANGDSCLKDEDCLSGICAGQTCVAASTILQDASMAVEDSSVPSDAAEAAAEGAPSKDSSTPKEAAPAEAASEAAAEAGGDATGEAATD